MTEEEKTFAEKSVTYFKEEVSEDYFNELDSDFYKGEESVDEIPDSPIPPRILIAPGIHQFCLEVVKRTIAKTGSIYYNCQFRYAGNEEKYGTKAIFDMLFLEIHKNGKYNQRSTNLARAKTKQAGLSFGLPISVFDKEKNINVFCVNLPYAEFKPVAIRIKHERDSWKERRSLAEIMPPEEANAIENIDEALIKYGIDKIYREVAVEYFPSSLPRDIWDTTVSKRVEKRKLEGNVNNVSGDTPDDDAPLPF